MYSYVHFTHARLLLCIMSIDFCVGVLSIHICVSSVCMKCVHIALVILSVWHFYESVTSYTTHCIWHV